MTMEPWLQVVVGASSIVGATGTVKAAGYLRETRDLASTAVTELRGTDSAAGLIERVDAVEETTEANTERSTKNRRVLRREGILQEPKNAD